MSTNADLFISIASHEKEFIHELNALFLDAAQNKVDDIQFRYEGEILKVEYVSDVVREVRRFEGENAKTICERIKSRADINLMDFQTPRDGRFRLRYKTTDNWPVDRELDLRVNVIPTDVGETFCIRLLAEMDDNLSLKNIEMPNAARNEFNALLREQQGIFIVCGPVGSGKTTLLFSLLNELRKKGKNIKTIEDPVEIVMPGIDQMQVSSKLSFAQGIRAMLRQRVHVGLVGEVRDDETAETAFRVGNTGSLVFFTLHANDAAMVISRCEDLGIDRETFAQSVKLIVFTRLIQTLPEQHEFPRVQPSDSAKNWLESAGLYDKEDRFVEARESEFTGRTPLFEMIKMTPELRRAIISTKNPREILEVAARQPQYESLTEHAVRLAREGRTTLTQVQDLVGETVHPIRSRRLDKQLYKHGLISAAEQFDCIQEWGRVRAEGKIIPLWKVIVNRGVVTLEQVINFLGFDDDAQNRIDYFVEQGYFTRDKVEPIIKKWKENAQQESLFKMLQEQDILDAEKIFVEPLLHFSRGGMRALD